MNDIKGQIPIDFSQGYRKGQKTSKTADEKANKKFKAKHSQLVYTAIRCYCNGGTAKEIAKKAREKGVNLTDEQVHKRLHDLKDNEYLRNGDDRKCKVSGRICKTWWVL